jgi:hypothetical protein
VRVWLLGGFRVSVDSRMIRDSVWRLRKAAALVKLLALSPGHHLHREQAMDLLWPDLGKRPASNNLRQVLHAARWILDPLSASPNRYLSFRNEQLVLCTERTLWVDARAHAGRAVRQSGDHRSGPVAHRAQQRRTPAHDAAQNRPGARGGSRRSGRVAPHIANPLPLNTTSCV